MVRGQQAPARYRMSWMKGELHLFDTNACWLPAVSLGGAWLIMIGVVQVKPPSVDIEKAISSTPQGILKVMSDKSFEPQHLPSHSATLTCTGGRCQGVPWRVAVTNEW
jgi:hypothetical protein